MLKRITTKESDIVNPLIKRASIQKSSESKRIPICIRRLNSLLADGPNLTADVKRFRFLGNIIIKKPLTPLGLSGFDIYSLGLLNDTA
jgi:hypothetical protein